MAQHPHVREAMPLLEERFRDARPGWSDAYASFLAVPNAEEEKARRRQEAVATVREFLGGFREIDPRRT